ncbi:MAG: hypothetical protein MRJ65_15200 [Candidatus Brocadiaceae bacterium]|nr:hypothetical protein [Candidatus Brocadiaceae bacterium]
MITDAVAHGVVNKSRKEICCGVPPLCGSISAHNGALLCVKSSAFGLLFNHDSVPLSNEDPKKFDLWEGALLPYVIERIPHCNRLSGNVLF